MHSEATELNHYFLCHIRDDLTSLCRKVDAKMICIPVLIHFFFKPLIIQHSCKSSVEESFYI